MRYCSKIVGDCFKKVTEQSHRKLRNEIKENKYAKTSKVGTDTKETKERKKRLGRKHPSK